MSIKKMIFILLLILFQISIAQNHNGMVGFWNLESFNGHLNLEGLYRSQETILKSGQTEKPNLTDFFGELYLRSQSFLWHPNLIQLTIDGKYHPGSRNENFLVLPDRSETKTAESIRIHSLFFKQRPLSLTLYSSYDHSYINREFTSNAELTKKDIGTSLAFRNRLLPVQAGYLYSDWKQNELQTGRSYSNTRNNLTFETDKSFGKKSQHKLRYSYDDYSRRYAGGRTISNQISNIKLRNVITLNHAKHRRFTSGINLYNQNGYRDYRRFQINENFDYGLNANLDFSTKYRYSNFEQASYTVNQHHFITQMEYCLYASLRSQLDYEYFRLSRKNSDEQKHIGGLNLIYDKIIPFGKMNITYNFKYRKENRESLPVSQNIINEEQELRDDDIILLNNPYINPESVVVTDITGTVIYSRDIDYILIPRNNYLEIQRLSGGQINNGDMVYIDYITETQNSYEFDAAINSFNIRLTFLKRLISLYYRYMDQDYHNVIIYDSRVLRRLHQNVYGFKFSKKMVTAGYERDNMNSNIIPYLSQRYYIYISGNLERKINLSLNGDYRDYKYDFQTDHYTYSTISGRINYLVTRKSKINLEGGYRLQDGRNLDLNLITIHTEYLFEWRKTSYAFGLEIYRRDFSGEKINYNGAYFRFNRFF